MQLYFASNNHHKRIEMSRLLGSHTLLLPKDKGIAFSPEENGQTYIENAIIKAEALYSIVKAPVISDDSGLSVKALGGAPGIHTARYGDDESSHQLSDRDRYMLLLKNMEGVKDRSAVFTTALCLILDENRRYPDSAMTRYSGSRRQMQSQQISLKERKTDIHTGAKLPG